MLKRVSASRMHSIFSSPFSPALIRSSLGLKHLSSLMSIFILLGGLIKCTMHSMHALINVVLGLKRVLVSAYIFSSPFSPALIRSSVEFKAQTLFRCFWDIRNRCYIMIYKGSTLRFGAQG